MQTTPPYRLTNKESKAFVNLWLSHTQSPEQLIKNLYNLIYKQINWITHICLLEDFGAPSKTRYFLYMANRLSESEIVLKDKVLEFILYLKDAYDISEIRSYIYICFDKVVRMYFKKRKPKSNLSSYIEKYLILEIINWMSSEFRVWRITQKTICSGLMLDYPGYKLNDIDPIILIDNTFFNITGDHSFPQIFKQILLCVMHGSPIIESISETILSNPKEYKNYFNKYKQHLEQLKHALMQ